jgi:blocked-early-in-transport protein 1
MSRRQPHHYDQNQGNSFGEPTQEGENDYLIDGLKSKVTVLKTLTIDMGDEIKSQNSFLKDMDNEFDSTWGKLSSSMKRVTKLAAAGHNRYIWYLLGFSLFVFFIIYIIMKTK